MRMSEDCPLVHTPYDNEPTPIHPPHTSSLAPVVHHSICIPPARPHCPSPLSCFHLDHCTHTHTHTHTPPPLLSFAPLFYLGYPIHRFASVTWAMSAAVRSTGNHACCGWAAATRENPSKSSADAFICWTRIGRGLDADWTRISRVTSNTLSCSSFSVSVLSLCL